jgi:hypothetical protein
MNYNKNISQNFLFRCSSRPILFTVLRALVKPRPRRGDAFGRRLRLRPDRPRLLRPPRRHQLRAQVRDVRLPHLHRVRLHHPYAAVRRRHLALRRPQLLRTRRRRLVPHGSSSFGRFLRGRKNRGLVRSRQAFPVNLQSGGSDLGWTHSGSDRIFQVNKHFFVYLSFVMF